MDDEIFIAEAIQLAESAKLHGNHPFGALLVINDSIVLRAENSVVTQNDPTNHAEMNLVRQAWKELNKEEINNSTLYTSTEPCAMCCGAIFWSGIRKVVFSCPAEELGKIANDDFCRPCVELFSNSKIKTEVRGPILKDQGVQVHENFWNQFDKII